MKDFSDFRNQWLTPSKENVLRERALEQTHELTVENERSFMATFSLLILFCFLLNIMSG